MSSGCATMQSARLILLSSGPENNRGISALPPEAARVPVHRDHVAPVLSRNLFHQQVVIGEGGDLSKVRDNQDLVPCPQRLESQTDLDGGLASDSRIHLVEHQG